MGRRLRSDSVDFGRNHDTVYPSDKAYVRCARCGFMCNTDRDMYSSEGSRLGYGISYVPYYRERTIISTIGPEPIAEPTPIISDILYNEDGDIVRNEEGDIVTVG